MLVFHTWFSIHLQYISSIMITACLGSSIQWRFRCRSHCFVSFSVAETYHSLMQCCCYFPLIVLYVLWGEAIVPSGFKSCSEPYAVTFLSLFLSLSFSHISNGRRHAGSQHGGEWWHRKGGAVFHIWLACPWKRMVGGSLCPWHAISGD